MSDDAGERIARDRARRAVVAFFSDREATTPARALPYRPGRKLLADEVKRMARAGALRETQPGIFWLDATRLHRVPRPGQARRMGIGLAVLGGVAAVATAAVVARRRAAAAASKSDNDQSAREAATKLPHSGT